MSDASRLIKKALASPDKAEAERLLLTAIDEVEWIEKGIAEWREQAREVAQQARAASATAKIAIQHLNTVLNTCRTHGQQQTADTQARDWLESIGPLVEVVK